MREVLTVVIVALVAVVLAGLTWFVYRRSKSIGGSDNVSSVPGERQPAFVINMLGGNVFELDEPPGWSGVRIEARIWNTGAPSFASGWQLQVTPRGGEPLSAEPMSPRRVTIRNPAPQPPLIIEETALQLERLTQSTNLTSDAVPVQSGLLFFVGLPKYAVLDPDTVWRLSVRDRNGREFSVTQRVGDWPRDADQR